MKQSLEDISKAHNLLKIYNGTNPYIINLKNQVFAFKTKTLNDFEIEYINTNFDKEPFL